MFRTIRAKGWYTALFARVMGSAQLVVPFHRQPYTQACYQRRHVDSIACEVPRIYSHSLLCLLNPHWCQFIAQSIDNNLVREIYHWVNWNSCPPLLLWLCSNQLTDIIRDTNTFYSSPIKAQQWQIDSPDHVFICNDIKFHHWDSRFGVLPYTERRLYNHLTSHIIVR